MKPERPETDGNRETRILENIKGYAENKRKLRIEGGLVRLSSPPMIEIKGDFHGIHFSDLGPPSFSLTAQVF